MYRESQKIHIIEEVLKVDNSATLNELETFFKKSKKSKPVKRSIYDFVGVLSDKEAEKMKKAINETCEVINEEDWK
ncbi:MAG: hypothetical protein K0Q79_3294 [Flavipsychrobacter sp.]|jgi:hypothetical protein|nr:hypothetical protein [Flavipsychrobacter sp.]